MDTPIQVTDRSEMIGAMQAQLELEPKRCAVVTIATCNAGH